MYIINSKTDKPCIDYMEKRVKEMMKCGIRLGDVEKIYEEFIGEKKELAGEIYNKYGIKNPNSNPQIIDYLKNIRSAEVYEVCYIDDKWTANKDAMFELSLLGYTFASDLLEYRKAKKYAESIKSMTDAMGNDGMVHPAVSLSKTNRINYSSPALMNIPKPLLWHLVKPYNNGDILFSADIKNQEPSILINILGADSLKDALTSEHGLYEALFSKPFKTYAKLNLLVADGQKPGVIPNSDLSDLGSVPPIYYTPIVPAVQSTYINYKKVRVVDIVNVGTAPGIKPELPSEVLIQTVDGEFTKAKVHWEDYNPAILDKQGITEIRGEIEGLKVLCEGIERQEFKTSWLAMTYGAGPIRIKQTCKHIDGQKFYSYFSKIPEFKQYKTLCRKKADNLEQYIQTYFGTILYAGEMDKKRLKRVLIDLPIQGTGADILSMLLRHFDSETKRLGISDKLWIYYTRHDELIIEAKKEFVEDKGKEEVKELIRELIEHKVDNWVPFRVDVKEVEAAMLYNSNTDDDIFG